MATSASKDPQIAPLDATRVALSPLVHFYACCPVVTRYVVKDASLCCSKLVIAADYVQVLVPKVHCRATEPLKVLQALPLLSRNICPSMVPAHHKAVLLDGEQIVSHLQGLVAVEVEAFVSNDLAFVVQGIIDNKPSPPGFGMPICVVEEPLVLHKAPRIYQDFTDKFTVSKAVDSLHVKHLYCR